MTKTAAKKPAKSFHVNRGVSGMDAEIGRRMRLIRIQLNMSQQRLGELLGVSFQQIQKYEKGVNRVSSGRLMDIAKSLQTNPHELMGWAEKGETAAIDSETYKFAKSFLEVPDIYKRSLRAHMLVIIEEHKATT